MFQFVVAASIQLDFVKVGTFHHPKFQPRIQESRSINAMISIFIRSKLFRIPSSIQAFENRVRILSESRTCEIRWDAVLRGEAPNGSAFAPSYQATIPSFFQYARLH